MTKIRVINNLARSGGTLFSKCVAAMDEVLLLSEIHPSAAAQDFFGFNVIHQAVKWHKLDIDPSVEKSADFLQQVALIHDACERRNKTLVLRDWAHVDFFGPPIHSEPSGCFSLNDLLETQYDVLSSTLLRHPLDMWLSFSRMKVVGQNNIDLNQYLAAYKRYVGLAQQWPMIKYEDLLQAPEATMQQVAKHLDVAFDENFMQSWHQQKKLTGDTNNVSRKGASTTIAPLSRRPVSDELLQTINSNDDYQWLLATLNYH